MARIATTAVNGVTRIVTKVENGVRRASCSCCETCCMYSAENYNGFTFDPEEQLPNAITINGASYSRIGSGYGDTTNGVFWNGEGWTKYINGASSQQNCLISSGIQDQFADQYLINSSVILVGDLDDYEIVEEGDDFLVTRVSLCRWESADSAKQLIFLDGLNENLGAFGQVWEVLGFDEQDRKQQEVIVGGDTFQQNMNDPLGFYSISQPYLRYVKPA